MEDLKATIQQSKARSREDWLRSDGAATMYCLERPMYKLVQIELDKRSMAEQEEWCKILEKSEKAARIRAIQLHFHVHTNLKFALPLTYSPTAIQPAKKVSATIMAMSKVEHGRQWIYDTGCHATSIGLKHLTSDEQKRISV